MSRKTILQKISREDIFCGIFVMSYQEVNVSITAVMENLILRLSKKSQNVTLIIR